MPTRRLALALAATLLSFWGLGVLAIAPVAEPERAIVVASTTSTQDSGLFGHLLPLFTTSTGIKVRVIAQGTGQALDTGRRGDADVLFVHAKPQEEKFVADGFGVRRYDVMYNDFVLVGPKDDPAGIAGTHDIAAALRAISDKQAPFISRGDRSGTHQAELTLWKDAGVDIANQGAATGTWYREIGQGMGAALNAAAAINAYVLSDRATWLAFKNRADLQIAVDGDKRLFNQYGIILINPDKFPHVQKDAGQAFIDWMLSPPGQKAIADFRVNGEQLFFPNGEGFKP